MMAEPIARPRVVVVGAGFGGMAAVQALKSADVDVTLIDRTNHHLFQPLLYQVATAALSPADIATATRALLRRNRNTTVLMSEVEAVDVDRRAILRADGPTLFYDYLILATGSAYSFFGHDEWAEHAPVLKSLNDALSIRERVLGAYEWAEECGDPAMTQRLLTFVIVGGGPTGVELAGTIAELARSTLRGDFKNIDPKSTRVVLCEAADRLLLAFPEHLSAYSARALASLGVEVHLSQPVNHIDSEGLLVGDTRIEAANILWCAGTAAQPAARWVGAEAARNGAVKVSPNCSVPGRPEIFAIGDVASFDSGSGVPLPGLAPVAKQQGKYVARVIKARVAGKREPGPFRYRNLGTMAIIGRSRAVADFGGFTLTGFPAWLAWSMVHLMLLVDFRSRLTVYVNWSWAWFTYGRGARLLTGRAGMARRLMHPPSGK
jgi:NADH:ubiquinone reductase (H+-translocating)